MVRFGDVQVVFEPTDDAMGTAKGGGTKVIEAFKPAPAPKAQGPVPVKRSVTPPPVPAKKGKGCGASAALFILGGTSLLYWILR